MFQSHSATNNIPFPEIPRSQDAAARNERLLPTLLGMGLVVQPLADANGGIDCFIVSTGLPNYVPQAQG